MPDRHTARRINWRSALSDPDTQASMARRGAARSGLRGHDCPADDFVELAEGWEVEHGQSVVAQSVVPTTNGTLDLIAKQFSAGQMRQLGSSLLKLADELDDDWRPAEVTATHSWVSKAARFERNAGLLSRAAILEEQRAKMREDAIGADLLGMPAWNMLLELFKSFAGEAMVSTKSLQIIAGCPEKTALRIIHRLEQRGLVMRFQTNADKRVTFVSLTQDGVAKVGAILERFGR